MQFYLKSGISRGNHPANFLKSWIHSSEITNLKVKIFHNRQKVYPVKEIRLKRSIPLKSVKISCQSDSQTALVGSSVSDGAKKKKMQSLKGKNGYDQ